MSTAIKQLKQRKLKLEHDLGFEISRLLNEFYDETDCAVVHVEIELLAIQSIRGDIKSEIKHISCGINL